MMYSEWSSLFEHASWGLVKCKCKNQPQGLPFETPNARAAYAARSLSNTQRSVQSVADDLAVEDDDVVDEDESTFAAAFAFFGTAGGPTLAAFAGLGAACFPPLIAAGFGFANVAARAFQAAFIWSIESNLLAHKAVARSTTHSLHVHIKSKNKKQQVFFFVFFCGG